MLRSVQKSLRSDKVAVLAPTPNTEQFLLQLDRRHARRNVSKAMWIVGSVAAGLAMLAVALNWFNAPQSTIPVRYQTVTEPDAAAAFHYVLLVSLDQSIGASEHLNILRALDPMSIASLETPGDYRMVVQLTARSLDELETYRKSVESISAIINASIVAIELPVESQ